MRGRLGSKWRPVGLQLIRIRAGQAKGGAVGRHPGGRGVEQNLNTRPVSAGGSSAYISHRRCLLAASLLVCALMVGCGDSREASSASSARLERENVVAAVAQTEPGDALRFYLHGWMLQYNEQALGEQQGASDVDWTPEKPDDFVSVIPEVPMTDFETVTVWSASIEALGPVSETHAAYRADFMFWRGNPLSSAGAGAVPLSSSATYDLWWDGEEDAWVITLTSDQPDCDRIESSNVGE